MKKVTINHPWDYPLLECDMCRKQFVLIEVLLKDNATQVQTAFMTCPFCAGLPSPSKENMQ